MSYQVNRFSSDSFNTGWPLLISDNIVNNTYGVNLLGRGVTNYGELIAENFVYLLENFAGINPPQNAITGQLWYEANPASPGVGTLRVFNGTSWVSIGGAQTGPTLPSLGNDGDLYYRLSAGNNQLFGYSNNAWNRIAGLASSAAAPTPANDGDLWLDLSIASNTAAAPNNKQRILKVQVSGAWYPIALGDPAGGAANNTSVSTDDNLIVFRSNGTVLGAWSNSVRTAPASLTSVFPNGLQIGLNLSNVANNKIVSPATNSNLVLGSNVLVQNNLTVTGDITVNDITSTGLATLNDLVVQDDVNVTGSFAVAGTSFMQSNLTMGFNGFIVEGIETALVATGTTQSTAAAITRQNSVISGGVADTGVRLPTFAQAGAGSKCTILNITTTNKRVWVPSGAAINGGSVNGSIDLGAGGSVTILCRSGTDYRTLNSIYG